MKKEELYEAIGQIHESYISQARERTAKKPRHTWLKWSLAAAGIALAVMLTSISMPGVLEEGDTSQEATFAETSFSQRYVYHIDAGRFQAYVGGKVIDEQKIGGKQEDVHLTAGWQDSEENWLTREHLRGTVYEINGIPQDVAVALKFLDLGEALTTTHYYVILNPDADLSVVEEYVIPLDIPGDPGEE